MRSWVRQKEEGKRLFEQEDFESALRAYQAALNPDLCCPTAERQILLSNIVACRLKIGGKEMAEAAVKDAKKCVALNDRWSKAHVRLASAYIALGDHSNDACNSLQRALALDSGNATARQMLIRELRRDHQQARSAPEPSAPPEYMDDNFNSSARPTEEATHQSPQSEATNNVDDSLSFPDRVRFAWMQVVGWYEAQHQDVKTFLKVVLAILVLYIAFGGRFGLTSSRQMRGNYRAGNAYDQYRNRAMDPRHSYEHHSNSRSNHNSGYTSSPSSRYNSRRTSSSRNQYSYPDDYSYQQPTRSSFGWSSLVDGSLTSLLFIGTILYVGHRSGLSVFELVFLLQMLMGRGGRRYGGGYRGGGFGRRRRYGGYRGGYGY